MTRHSKSILKLINGDNRMALVQSLERCRLLKNTPPLCAALLCNLLFGLANSPAIHAAHHRSWSKRTCMQIRRDGYTHRSSFFFSVYKFRRTARHTWMFTHFKHSIFTTIARSIFRRFKPALNASVTWFFFCRKITILAIIASFHFLLPFSIHFIRLRLKYDSDSFEAISVAFGSSH